MKKTNEDSRMRAEREREREVRFCNERFFFSKVWRLMERQRDDSNSEGERERERERVERERVGL